MTQPDKSDTPFGRYVRETGTNLSWVARSLGVSRATVSGWVTGRGSPREESRARLLALLEARAAVDLAAVFAAWHSRPRNEVGGTPFEQALRRAE